jgi:transcriptional regulator with XRE-family HTH domain
MMTAMTITVDRLRQASEAVHALRAIPAHERRKLRAEAGISRVVLAELLGVSVERVKGYEEGVTPSGELAYRYRQALDAMTPPPLDPPLTDEARARLNEYFTSGEVCAHCRGVHVRACPRVKRMSYHDNQTLAEVEFWPDGKWPTENVIFPDSPEMSE